MRRVRECVSVCVRDETWGSNPRLGVQPTSLFDAAALYPRHTRTHTHTLSLSLSLSHTHTHTNRRTHFRANSHDLALALARKMCSLPRKTCSLVIQNVLSYSTNVFSGTRN
jgi:hypothetical protein